MIKNQIIGLSELSANFRKLDATMRAKTARRMVATAAADVRGRARSIAAAAGLRRTGSMIRNVVIKRQAGTKAGEVQYNIGVRHGRDLGRSAKSRIVVTAGGRLAKKYENDPWYWLILHGGAKPHTIVARKGKTLSVGGLFVRRVRHPGVRAVPFITMAMDQSKDAAVGIMARVLMEDLRRIGK